MNKFNDNDIREALRRSEEKRTAPTVPDDFFDSVMGRIETEPKTIKLWRWVAAAACIALMAGIGSAILFADKTVVESASVVENIVPENTEKQLTDIAETDSVADPVVAPEPKIEAPETKAAPAAKPKPATQPAPNPNLRIERPQYAENEPTTVAADSATIDNATSQDEANINYAENQSKNDETNFAPAMLDEFIEMLAEIQGVNKIHSECSVANDTSFVETFYVFPVKKEYNVLEQFAWMVGNYSKTSPGYIFNNSGRQVFFSIDDEQNGLNYLWIAERIDDSKIMIYSVHAPIDIEYESDCYQQFYDDLTFSNFNTYY
jgi:hypothetical protein